MELIGSGQIIYHGPVLEVQKYFNDLGYVMPSNMDVADFLQELPTSSARRFIDEVGALVMRISAHRCVGDDYNCISLLSITLLFIHVFALYLERSRRHCDSYRNRSVGNSLEEFSSV
jgi:hypothetical protein